MCLFFYKDKLLILMFRNCKNEFLLNFSLSYNKTFIQNNNSSISYDLWKDSTMQRLLLLLENRFN